MAEPAHNRVGTTEKSLTILEFLQREDGAGITEIATALGMSKSTVHSHLATLVDCGYVSKLERQYRVSTKLLGLGGRLRDQSPLYQAAQAEMTSLAASTGGVVRLYLKERGDATVIAQEGHHPSIPLQHLGQRTPLSESVAGPVMFAEDGRDTDGETDVGPDVDDDVRDRFEHIRRRGYSVETSSDTAPCRTFAAALSRKVGTVMGALTVTVPNDVDSDPSPGEQLLEAAERTELSLTSWYDSRATFSPKHSWHVPPE